MLLLQGLKMNYTYQPLIKNNSAFKKDSFINLLSEGLKNDFSSDEIIIERAVRISKD